MVVASSRRCRLAYREEACIRLRLRRLDASCRRWFSVVAEATIAEDDRSVERRRVSFVVAIVARVVYGID